MKMRLTELQIPENLRGEAGRWGDDIVIQGPVVMETTGGIRLAGWFRWTPPNVVPRTIEYEDPTPMTSHLPHDLEVSVEEDGKEIHGYSESHKWSMKIRNLREDDREWLLDPKGPLANLGRSGNPTFEEIQYAANRIVLNYRLSLEEVEDAYPMENENE